MRLALASRGGSVASLLVTLVTLGATVVAAPAAHADDVDCSSVNASTAPRPSTDVASAALEHMGLPTPLADGAGVTVAVVDSGAGSFHGTAAAGLINGPARSAGKPVGIAPAATVNVVPVYAQDQNAPATPSPDAVAGGLQSLVGGPAAIVVIPLQVPSSPALKAAVAALVGQGVVVVAPSGDRDTGQESSSPYTGNEDASDSVFPADYPGVVAVAAAVADPPQVMLANSRTMLAAPMTGSIVSYAVGGGTCLVPPSSGFAAAEVGGVLALLKQHFPHASAAELVQRLTQTATGRTDVTNDFQGAGVVQPVEALTRPLAPPAASPSAAPAVQPATLPRAEPDLLRGTRRSAVWWGLGAGGLLIVALLLRPLFARRTARR